VNCDVISRAFQINANIILYNETNNKKITQKYKDKYSSSRLAATTNILIYPKMRQLYCSAVLKSIWKCVHDRVVTVR